MTIPEIDEARWFDLGDAHRHILPSQTPLLDRLVDADRTASESVQR